MNTMGTFWIWRGDRLYQTAGPSAVLGYQRAN